MTMAGRDVFHAFYYSFPGRVPSAVAILLLDEVGGGGPFLHWVLRAEFLQYLEKKNFLRLTSLGFQSSISLCSVIEV